MVDISAYRTILIGVGEGAIAGFLVSLFVVQRILNRRVLREVSVRQEQFSNLASHYLLSPITIIQTAISELRDRDPNLTLDERTRYYEAIVRGQQRLWIITEQLMITGDLTDNKLQLSYAVGDPMDVVTGAISALDAFAREKQVRVTFRPTTNGLSEARFDVRRLKQALIAVIDNAIKFSETGGTIEIRLSLADDAWQIEVEDEGIGMSADIMAHLSEKFYRGTSIYNFDYEGMGLGLYIAQSIIALHGGSITFASQPKRGTIATIRFPNL